MQGNAHVTRARVPRPQTFIQGGSRLLSMNEANRPKCPEHPEVRVSSAHVPGSDRRVWVCLRCGKKLGDAGPYSPPEWEKQEIK
jgi:hypothetical protein